MLDEARPSGLRHLGEGRCDRRLVVVLSHEAGAHAGDPLADRGRALTAGRRRLRVRGQVDRDVEEPRQRPDAILVPLDRRGRAGARAAIRVMRKRYRSAVMVAFVINSPYLSCELAVKDYFSGGLRKSSSVCARSSSVLLNRFPSMPVSSPTRLRSACSALRCTPSATSAGQYPGSSV